MKGSKAVVGVFSYIDDTIEAIRAAKAGSFEYTVYSPVPAHEIEEETMPEKSPVRLVTATGALIGITFGFTLATWTSMDWPLRTSAKAIASVPAFVVVGYECTILFGGIFTLMAMFFFCGIPNLIRSIGYDPRFSGDKFGVVVSCEQRDVELVREAFKKAGADEVEVKDAL